MTKITIGEENVELEIGDILICKSHSVIGALIGNAFRCASPLRWSGADPFRPSSHNGIFGYDVNFEPVIFEATFGGFVATPIDVYVRLSLEKKCEVKFARIPGGLSDYEQIKIRQWCLNNLGAKYDFRAYLSFLWRLVLRLPPVWNSNLKAMFYCTEAVNLVYLFINILLIDEELPAPIHVEKLCESNKLEIIDEWI